MFTWKFICCKEKLNDDFIETNDLHVDEILFDTLFTMDDEERKVIQVKTLESIKDMITGNDMLKLAIERRITEILNNNNRSFNRAISCRITEILNDQNITKEDFLKEMSRVFEIKDQQSKFICTIIEED